MDAEGFSKLSWRNWSGIRRAVAHRPPFVIHYLLWAGGKLARGVKLLQQCKETPHGLDHSVVSAGCAEDLGAEEVEPISDPQVCRLGNRLDGGGVCSESQ